MQIIIYPDIKSCLVLLLLFCFHNSPCIFCSERYVDSMDYLEILCQISTLRIKSFYCTVFLVLCTIKMIYSLTRVYVLLTYLKRFSAVLKLIQRDVFVTLHVSKLVMSTHLTKSDSRNIEETLLRTILTNSILLMPS